MMIVRSAEEKFEFSDLLSIMNRLRRECPWDKTQTHQSIKRNLLEETYEALEAIEDSDMSLLKEELGDVLLQVVFHSEMASETGSFSIDDVIDGICKKLIHRHPHIFSNVSANTSEEVLSNWEEIKKKEKGLDTKTEAMKKIPKTLPALMKSYKMQARAASAGFDWDNIQGAWDKLDEEIGELKEAIKEKSFEDQEEELGDLLFAAVNVSRFLKIDPETALLKTCEKFLRRFSFVEEEAKKRHDLPIEKIPLLELDKLWEEFKHKEKDM